MFYVESALLGLILEHYFFEDSRRKKRVAELVDDGSDYYKNLKKLNYDPKSGTIVVDGKRTNLNITNNPYSNFSVYGNRHERKASLSKFPDSSVVEKRGRGGTYVSQHALKDKLGFTTGIHEWQHNRNQVPMRRHLNRGGYMAPDGKVAELKEYTVEERKKILDIKNKINKLKRESEQLKSDIIKTRSQDSSLKEKYRNIILNIRSMENDLKDMMNNSSVSSKNSAYQHALKLHEQMLTNQKKIQSMSSQKFVNAHDSKSTEMDADLAVPEYSASKDENKRKAISAFAGNLKKKYNTYFDKGYDQKTKKAVQQEIDKVTGGKPSELLNNLGKKFIAVDQKLNKPIAKYKGLKEHDARGKNLVNAYKAGLKPIKW